MTALLTQKKNFIKSPLNYMGGKYKLLSQILPLFPKEIDIFVDLFCGGLNVAINVKNKSNSSLFTENQINAKKIVCNDNLIYLIQLYKFLRNEPLALVLEKINFIIKKYDLNLQNTQGYNDLRKSYNTDKSPIVLLVLIAYSFNHQIRFNNAHEFNNPFGKARSSFNPTMKENLIKFIQNLQGKNIEFTSLDFKDFLGKFTLTNKSFVYADPPYLITQGTYNDGKRGFSGWNEILEKTLLKSLDKLHKNSVKFALSNVLIHKNKRNEILQSWIKQNGYYISKLNHHYTNASYQAKHKDKTKTQEVLITNYNPSEV